MLSGFLEADGNFYSYFNVNSTDIVKEIKYYMRIFQRSTYSRKNNENNYSYLPLIKTIKIFLDVSKVKEITRIRDNYTEYVYEVRTDKRNSCENLINYLLKYPLFSSKHQDFLAWKNIHEINKSKKYKTIEGSSELISLKNNMNNLRTQFNWDSLNNFYTF